MDQERIGRLSVLPARVVLDRRVSPQAVRVLAALATFADKDGWCWPSQGTLGEMVACTRQAVAKHLQKLEEHGWIESRRQFRENGGETSKHYRLLYDAQLEEPGSDAPPPATPEVAPPATKEVAPPAAPEVAGPATPEVARMSQVNVPTERSLSVCALSAEQQVISDHLQVETRTKVHGGADAPPTGWCEDLVRRGAKQSDVDYAIQAAIDGNKRSRPYVRAVLERRVEERERGNDPDAGERPRAVGAGGRANRGAGGQRNGAGRRGPGPDGRGDRNRLRPAVAERAPDVASDDAIAATLRRLGKTDD